jgi:hypothetical protein
MGTDNTFSKDIQNLTTTTIINAHYTVTTQSFDDNTDMLRVISYAIPLSCLAILMVLLLAIGINRRHRVLEKWTSLKRMRNTNPRFLERTGLRRDSEFDSDTEGFVSVTIINDDGQFRHEPDFRLATIT